MWKLIRYRRLQALSIALLAALITTCAVFAPLYDRATQQALVDAIGDLLWRGGACRHVVTVQGRCPRRAGELMVSAADRRIFDYQVGTRIRVAGDVLDPNAPPATATAVPSRAASTATAT